MDYVELLKKEYISIIIFMYLCIGTYQILRIKHPIISKYDTKVVNLFYVLLITRSIAFDYLKEYHENEIRHSIGILKFDIVFPIAVLCIVFLIVALVILYDVIKTKGLEAHEFEIFYNNETDFKEVLHSLKARGVKVFDEKIVNKKNQLLKFKVRFYDISYKEAFHYKNEFYKGETSKTFNTKFFIKLSIVFTLDIVFQMYRISSNNYTTIFEYIGDLFSLLF